MKTVQYFTKDYLERCRKIPVSKRLQFLEDFRKLRADSLSAPSRLISLRIPEELLRLFRQKCAVDGKKYQTKINELIKEYASGVHQGK